MGIVWQDTRYAFRMFGKYPGFAALVIGILGVGIAANTALFSVVNAVLLRPLPYKDSDRLVTIWEKGSLWDEGFRARAFFPFLCENNNVFAEVGGWCRRVFYVRGIETPHEVHACEVTANLFPMLGVEPLWGRGFRPEDETPAGRHVVILSHRFWQEHMGGTPDVLGKDVTLTSSTLNESSEMVLSRASYTVIGVMPPGFGFPYRSSTPLWRPLVLSQAIDGRLTRPIFPLARLKKGATPEQADANLGVLAGRLRQTAAKAKVEAGKVGVTRLLDGLVEGHRKLPLLLLGAAGFVLLIACGNAANLFLARATVRRREMAMRVALGASRHRVVRQMLTESLLLSLGAGALGLVLTFATVGLLVRLCPADVPRLQETRVDLTVLGFTLVVSILTGLVFGMMPAWRASDVSVSETLKEGASRTTTGRRWRRLHSGLVVSQLGLSLILLIGATLLIRSLIGLTSMDLGFQPDKVVALQIELPHAKYTEGAQYNGFFWPLLERLKALPGVRSASALCHGSEVTDPLVETGLHSMEFSIAEQADPTRRYEAGFMMVTPDYFTTMSIPFLAGQTLTDQGPDSVVIDKTFARRCLPDVDPVGQTLFIREQPVRIVGVVETVRCFDELNPEQGVVYAPARGFIGFALLLVRTEGDPANMLPAIRGQVAELEKDRVIKAMEPFTMTLSRMLAPRRFVMLLLGLFAAIALGLATVGIYGLLQYSTAQQTHDIGIRMALGARKGDILRTVLARGIQLAIIGVAVGLAGAVVLTRVLASLLYDITPTDPVTLIAVSCAMIVIALLASYVPARRAAKVDPMTALRCE